MSTKRPSCPDCFRPIKECYCHAVNHLSSEVQLVILQHPSEVNHPFNTARMAELALDSCNILVGEQFEFKQPELSELNNEDFSPVLLFPVENAVSVAEYRAETKAQGKKPVVVIPDGTWKKARKILHSSPQIASLSGVDLGPLGDSIYSVRQSNQTGGVSTVEAIYQFLSQWHGDTEQFYPLLQPLQWLVQRQRRFMPENRRQG